MTLSNMQAIIEAVLFTMGEVVETSKLALAIDQDISTTRKIVRNIMDTYNNESHGLKIIEIADGFQMCTKPECFEGIVKVATQPKKHVLTDVVIETLSIIAYKQPVTKMEIEKIRGVKCDHAVNKLIEFNLVTELGRLDAPGRPLLFGTTEEFLRTFGLQSVEELPEINQDKLTDFQIEAEEETQLTLNI